MMRNNDKYDDRDDDRMRLESDRGLEEFRLRSLIELLLLEDSYLPLVMNWASIEGWSDLLLFLLESDSLRFPSISMTKTADRSKHIQDSSALSRIVESYLTPSELALSSG
jgi:hypothetical protein